MPRKVQIKRANNMKADPPPSMDRKRPNAPRPPPPQPPNHTRNQSRSIPQPPKRDAISPRQHAFSTMTPKQEMRCFGDYVDQSHPLSPYVGSDTSSSECNSSSDEYDDTGFAKQQSAPPPTTPKHRRKPSIQEINDYTNQLIQRELEKLSRVDGLTRNEVFERVSSLKMKRRPPSLEHGFRIRRLKRRPLPMAPMVSGYTC